jgi:hypothetical protein
MNFYQKSVWKQLNEWRHAAASFKKWSRRKGNFFLSHDPTMGEVRTSVIEVRDWRRRLARMIRQARKRQRVKDWDWFAWLWEYCSMVSATIRDDFRQFDKTIIRGGKAMKQVKAASKAANAPKKARADAKVLEKFAVWRRKVAAALHGLTTAQQVRKYHITQRPAPRDKRRLNALLKAGAIK